MTSKAPGVKQRFGTDSESRLVILRVSVVLLTRTMSAYAIVDSHVHLYPHAEVSSLAWCNEQHPLYGQYSIDEYLRATRDLSDVAHSTHNLQGFVFIETDRKSSLETESGWEEPLRELDWIKRIADGAPRPGEGHSPQHAPLCLGIVPWAPLPSGSEVMSTYVQKAADQLDSTWRLVKGFRYLVQDKPAGTMLTDPFIDSLKWLGRNGYAFDLGVDARSGGLWQLREAVEMIRKAHEGEPESKKVTIVISTDLIFITCVTTVLMSRRPHVQARYAQSRQGWQPHGRSFPRLEP